MSTVIRPELSPRNKHWIEKHRYYELKHFCMQYPIWLKAYLSLDSLSHRPEDLLIFKKEHHVSDPTARCAEARIFYKNRMKMVENAANETDPDLSKYLLEAVTNGWSYETLKTRLDIPCCKDTYYESYRKFFWILNKLRE